MFKLSKINLYKMMRMILNHNLYSSNRVNTKWISTNLTVVTLAALRVDVDQYCRAIELSPDTIRCSGGMLSIAYAKNECGYLI